ncbi:MAG: hypothetical protein ACYS1C_02405 [Planctomycetota bacterium]|jgi:hypothetical protein
MPIEPFAAKRYTVRGRVFGLFGRLRVEAEDGRPVASGIVRSHWSTFSISHRSSYSISVVSGERPEREHFVIQARPKSRLSDVVDVASGERIGALRRKDWVPLARDQWTVFDAEDKEIGVIREESVGRAWLNRLWPEAVSRRFRGEVEGRQVCTLRELRSLFAMKIEVDCSDDVSGAMDPRLVIAVALLLCTLGRQG